MIQKQTVEEAFDRYNPSTKRAVRCEAFGIACYVYRGSGEFRHVGVLGTGTDAANWLAGDDSVPVVKIYD